jgi:hypothetical protein
MKAIALTLLAIAGPLALAAPAACPVPAPAASPEAVVRAVASNISPDETCGGASGYTCPTGQCCSKYGWCGTTAAYCGADCQSGFGTCTAGGSTTGGSAPAAAPKAPAAAPAAPAPAPAAPAPAPAAASPSPAAAAAPAVAPGGSANTAGTTTPPTTTGSKASTPLTAGIIEKINPATSSCAGAAYPDECITAAQAAPAVALSYGTYNIDSPGAQAAVLALMMFESDGFVYDQKHFPPTPGQGTRNMMSPQFVSQYATHLLGAAAVSAAGSPAAVLQLVSGLDDSCGSGAWFLATVCPGVLAQFATDPEGAWTAYYGSGCISTTLTADRTALWNQAKVLFGVA